LNSQRGAGRDLIGKLLCGNIKGLTILANTGDKSHLQGFFRIEIPSCQSQFSEPAVSDDVRQALQSTHIGNDTETCLPDTEERVLRRQADITSSDQVDAAPDTMAVNCSDNRFSTLFNGCYVSL